LVWFWVQFFKNKKFPILVLEPNSKTQSQKSGLVIRSVRDRLTDRRNEMTSEKKKLRTERKKNCEKKKKEGTKEKGARNRKK